MKVIQNSIVAAFVSLISIFGVRQPVQAQDLSAFTDCAVVSAKTRFRGNNNSESTVEIQIVPGVGSAFQNQFYTSALPPGHRSPSEFTCKHRNTLPVTNGQVSTALSAHLEQINSNIQANTVEVQQTVAQSFAIQIDILVAEVADIRSLLSGVDEQDAAVIGARLDSLEARLDALTQIANN